MSQSEVSSTGSTTKQPGWRRGLITVALLAMILLSWSGIADQFAQDQTLPTFKKALAAAALARTFNGVISVAQGTEVAIQPVGVGVTLTLGEILDPLNDLVERFSVLALAASVSLGVQMTVGDIASAFWLSLLLSIGGGLYLLLLWFPGTSPAYAAGAARIVAALIFARFLLVAVLLATHLINVAFLNDRQDTAMTQLAATSTAIEQMQHEQLQQQAVNSEDDFFDRTGAQLKNLLNSSSQALDLRSQLAAVEEKIEASIEDMIRLIAIFVLQTLLLPLAGTWLCWKLLQRFWDWDRRRTEKTPS